MAISHARRNIGEARPEQNLLLPASLREWLPEDHLAYFVSDLIDQLDLSAITTRYDEERGYPPYHLVRKALANGFLAGAIIVVSIIVIGLGLVLLLAGRV